MSQESEKSPIALVTGGGSGIGRATALAFAHRGISVTIADINLTAGSQTVQMIQEAGGEAKFVKADVSKHREVRELMERVIGWYGRLDYAVNNAGVEESWVSTAGIAEEDWDRIIAMDLKSVWLCMKYELPPMMKRRSGVIVNTASVAGLSGFRQAAAYVASKHGVVGLTKTAALEYAKYGIRVNAVCPGMVRTPMVERLIQGNRLVEFELVREEPVGRFGTPTEIADAIMWLCSPQSSFVTGVALAVDGGWTAQGGGSIGGGEEGIDERAWPPTAASGRRVQEVRQ